MKIPERRGMERFSFTMDFCTISSKNAPDYRAEHFCIDNICAGGAFIRTREVLPIGTDVTLDMILPLKDENRHLIKQSQIIVAGEVVRTAEEGMAVEFGKQYSIAPYPG